MATFEEKWEQFKATLQTHVPDWNRQFLNWADARGFGFGGGFFNEFPHTHTYETDLSWLISRMKWVLFRMDSVEERMRAVEELLNDFIGTLDIDDVILTHLRELLLEMVRSGELNELIREIITQMETELMGVYLPQNARPIAGYSNIRDTYSKHQYSTDWQVGSNFNDGGKKISTSGNLYIIAYETYDRILLYVEVPMTGSGATIGTGYVNLKANALTRLHNAIGRVIDDTSPTVYAAINPGRYINGARIEYSNTEPFNINSIYIGQVFDAGSGGGSVHITVYNLKKETPGFRS